jgi:hypothetical protein|tara:strand:- start:195 stop:470 length:276 start_codon:yes stop_codon:yes gene_type:complete
MGLPLLILALLAPLIAVKVGAQPISPAEAAMFACIIGTVETAGAAEEYVDAAGVLEHCTCRGVRDANVADMIELCPEVRSIPISELTSPRR